MSGIVSCGVSCRHRARNPITTTGTMIRSYHQTSHLGIQLVNASSTRKKLLLNQIASSLETLGNQYTTTVTLILTIKRSIQTHTPGCTVRRITVVILSIVP